MDRELWWRTAAGAGAIVAPAGLNHVVSGTTYWICDGFRQESFGCAVASTGGRLPLDAPLSEVVTRWRGVPVPRLRVTPWLLFDLNRTGLSRERRDLLLGAAAVLEAMGLIEPYRDAGLPYLPDMLHNGLTVLAVTRQ